MDIYSPDGFYVEISPESAKKSLWIMVKIQLVAHSSDAPMSLPVP